jgi:hypothetical protein
MSYREPETCPDCKRWASMSYTSDRSGNVRRYKCSHCGAVFLATLKGLPLESCIGDKGQRSSDKFDWVRVWKG